MVGKDGEAGPPGPSGERGPAGPQGSIASAREWSAEVVSYQGDVATHKGSLWQARKDTGKEPPHKDWRLIAAAGRDGINGKDGRGFFVRGTFKADETYFYLDIVAKDGGSFVATKDSPGPCPGDGWQLFASRGSRGDKGQVGERGPKGEIGPAGKAAPMIVSWNIDRAAFRAVPVMSDGSEGPALELRALFQEFQMQTR
jgi:hypothetical protein